MRKLRLTPICVHAGEGSPCGRRPKCGFLNASLEAGEAEQVALRALDHLLEGILTAAAAALNLLALASVLFFIQFLQREESV